MNFSISGFVSIFVIEKNRNVTSPMFFIICSPSQFARLSTAVVMCVLHVFFFLPSTSFHILLKLYNNRQRASVWDSFVTRDLFFFLWNALKPVIITARDKTVKDIKRGKRNRLFLTLSVMWFLFFFSLGNPFRVASHLLRVIFLIERR